MGNNFSAFLWILKKKNIIEGGKLEVTWKRSRIGWEFPFAAHSDEKQGVRAFDELPKIYYFTGPSAVYFF